MPAIIRVALIFVLMLAVIKRKWSLGNTFLVASFALGLIFTMHPAAILKALWFSLIDPKTVSLAVVVCLILILSNSLETSGQMGRMLARFKGLIRRPKINLVIFPALIGLLPMPGGAVFSAPMVKNLGDEQHLSASQLSYINYWYRHIWEYWWPLYPGILLVTTLAGLNLWRLVMVTFPLTLVAVAAGYWPLRRGSGQQRLQSAMAAFEQPSGAKSVLPFFKELMPIALAIVLGLGLGLVFTNVLPGFMVPVAKESGLIVALAAAILWVWRINAMAPKQCWALISQPAMLNMVYMIVAILMFRGVLEESRAVMMISREMIDWQIPIMAIAMILPFVVGGLTGITIAFVGVAFPILIPLIEALGHSAYMPFYMMLALVSGFAGVLLSPLHLCFVLSNQYFHISAIAVYRHMRLPIVALIAAGALYFVVLRYVVG